MGANVTMWVEVEVTTKVWRESYGVTDDDALRNAEVGVGERLTGRVKFDGWPPRNYDEGYEGDSDA